ncbi:MAG: M1 family aminopeptidase [bacterium]
MYNWKAYSARLFAATILPAIVFSNICVYGNPSVKKDFLVVYKKLKNNEFDGPVYTLNNSLKLSFPDFSVTFEKGHFRRLYGFDASGAGFVFQGKGFVDYAPRHAIEQRQLLRFTDKQNLHAEFDLFVLKSTSDKTDFTDIGQLSWLQNLDEKTLDFAKTAESALLKRLGFNLSSRLLTEYTHGPAGFTACIFRNINEGPTFPPIYYYFYDPVVHEQIQFMQFRPKTLGKPFYTICRYPLGDYLTPSKESKLRVTLCNGRIEIKNGGQITADIGLDIFVGFNRIKSLYFQFSKLLKLEWATTIHGDSLNFIREKDQTGFTLFLPDTIALVDTLRLNFHYNGKILEKKNDGNLYLKDPILWHPRLGYLKRSRYKIIFKYPQNLQLIATGELLKEWLENENKLSYYCQRQPAKAGIFVLGKFKQNTFQGPHDININIFSASQKSSRVLSSINKDISSSLYMFSQYLDPYRYDQIKVVESYGIESQGFPGFVKLSRMAFRTTSGGILTALRSHEIAHQWWGNVIGWRTYRDQWLSESFAEYMSALYLAYILPGKKQFEQILTAWRDDLLDGGNIGVSLGLKRFGFSKEALRNSDIEKAGPIYLGMRLGQKEAAEYYLLVYQKGAYLLHTLRNYLRDDATGSDAKFWKLLKDYLNIYSGRDPSTQDFIALVSKHAGEDMNWFFEQWLLDSVIPSYSYQHEIIRKDAGYKVIGKIAVKGTGSNFKSFIPISIVFSNNESIRTRAVFAGNDFQLDLGPYHHKPQKIEFNSDKAVLARE